MQFLIVEDEPLIAADLEAIILSMGHDVVGVADTQALAVELVERVRPDAAFVDVKLRDGFTGVEIGALLRARLNIPVVFLTGNAELVPGGGSVGSGMRVLQKPFTEDHIRTAVASIAESPEGSA